MEVQFDELEMTDDKEMLQGVTYQGKPFTGTAVEENFECEYEDGMIITRTYVDGKAHGRWTEAVLGGQLLEESFYEDGELLTQRTWSCKGEPITHYQKEPWVEEQFYPDGSMKIQQNEDGIKKYYENGQLLEHFDYAANGAVFYDKDGTWIVRHKTDGEKKLEMDCTKITFHDEALCKRYLKLLEEVFDQFDDYVALWIETVQKEERAQIVCDMIASDNLWIKVKGIQLAEKYQVSQALELLERERNNEAAPPKRETFDGGLCFSTHSVCDYARPAIGTLKNKELWKKIVVSQRDEFSAVKEERPVFDEELYKKVAEHRTIFCAGPQEEHVIRDWEKKIGVTFPKSYVEFLKRFGYGAVCGFHYAGISDENFSSLWRDMDRYRNLYAVPPELLVVRSYNSIACENRVSHNTQYFICLDTSRMSGGDCPVVLCTYKDCELVSVEDYAVNFWEAFNMANEEALKEIKESGEEEAKPQLALPDGTGFGCCFMVVEGAATKAVVEAFLEEETKKYAYSEGVKLANGAQNGAKILAVTAAYEKKIFVIGNAVSKFFYGDTQRFLEKMKPFSKVYVYMTEHVSETHGFALVEKGELKRLFCYDEEEIKNIGAPTAQEMALAFRLPKSFADVRNKNEEFTKVNEDMVVELAIMQTGMDIEQYPYKKVTVGRMAE